MVKNKVNLKDFKLESSSHRPTSFPGLFSAEERVGAHPLLGGQKLWEWGCVIAMISPWSRLFDNRVSIILVVIVMIFVIVIIIVFLVIIINCSCSNNTVPLIIIIIPCIPRVYVFVGKNIHIAINTFLFATGTEREVEPEMSWRKIQGWS